MLSISSFIDLYNNSDLQLYLGGRIYNLDVEGPKNTPSKEQPATWSDIRNIFVASPDGKLKGTVTDKNYTKYFNQKICLYFPYNYKRFNVDANYIFRLHGWKILESGNQYTNPIKTFNGALRWPIVQTGYAKYNAYLSSDMSNRIITSQLLDVSEYALRYGESLDGLLKCSHDVDVVNPVTMVKHLTRFNLGETAVTSFATVTMEKQHSKELFAKSPMFSVFQSDKGVLDYEDTVRYHLIPTRSGKTQQLYLCDETKIDNTTINRLKLRGVTASTSGMPKYREAISCGHMLENSGECAANVKKIFDFMLSVIGTGDMYVIEPMVYGMYFNPPSMYSGIRFKPFGTSKKYKRLCKNETIQKGIETIIDDRLKGYL